MQENNNLLDGPFLSPMVRAAFPGMREVCRRNGASITFTDAVVASNLLQADLYESDIDYQFMKPASRVFQIAKAEKDTTIVQIVGSDPEVLYQATLLLKGICLGVDLNCGCTKSWVGCQYGSNLLSDLDLMCRCLDAMRRAATKAGLLCSAKIRLLETVDDTAVLVKKLFTEIGLDIVTIHARHVYEERGKNQANLEDFAKIYNTVKSFLKPNQRLAYNGDIWGAADYYRVQAVCNDCAVEELFQGTAATVPIMIARGAIRDPTVFQAVRQAASLVRAQDLEGYKKQRDQSDETSTTENILQLIDASKVLHGVTEDDYTCKEPSVNGRCTDKIQIKDYKFQQLRCCIQFLLKQQQEMPRDVPKKQLDKYIAQIAQCRTVSELEEIFKQ